MKNIKLTQAENLSKIYSVNSSFAETYYNYPEILFDIGGAVEVNVLFIASSQKAK